MFNTVKMNLFLLTRQKSTYIILVIVALLLFTTTMIEGSQKQAENPIEIESSEEKNSIKLYEENYVSGYETKNNITSLLASCFSGNIVPMVLMIFTGLFAGTYQRYRVEKNIIGVIGKRYRLPCSLMAVNILYIGVLMILILLVSTIGYVCFMPGFSHMDMGNIAEFILFFITYYIIMLYVCTVMVFFVEVVGNQIVAIVIALVYGSGIPYDIIDFFVRQFGIERFSVKNVLPLGISYGLSANIGANPYWNIIVLCLGPIIVCLGLNILIKQRKDVCC